MSDLDLDFFMRFGENEGDPTFAVSLYDSAEELCNAVATFLQGKFEEVLKGTEYVQEVYFGCPTFKTISHACTLRMTKGDLEKLREQIVAHLHEMQARPGCPKELKDYPEPTLEDCTQRVAEGIAEKLVNALIPSPEQILMAFLEM